MHCISRLHNNRYHTHASPAYPLSILNLLWWELCGCIAIWLWRIHQWCSSSSPLWLEFINFKLLGFKYPLLLSRQVHPKFVPRDKSIVNRCLTINVLSCKLCHKFSWVGRLRRLARCSWRYTSLQDSKICRFSYRWLFWYKSKYSKFPVWLIFNIFRTSWARWKHKCCICSVLWSLQLPCCNIFWVFRLYTRITNIWLSLV